MGRAWDPYESILRPEPWLRVPDNRTGQPGRNPRILPSDAITDTTPSSYVTQATFLSRPASYFQNLAAPQTSEKSDLQHECHDPEPPVKSNLYFTSSCASEASSLTSDTAEVICCTELGCAAQFTGNYRKGNLARHRRIIHKRLESYICESNGCRRTFKRQDARLKHYRKYHPHLHVGPPVPRRGCF
jgi:hypothetical protein